mmetsp:Transcript_30625/g.55511  ORF Transcript_30625/g.55511 Transcript_30625/m.55511 type:complete len:322 (+) Transcript_30625:2679-3644(+)
MQVDTRIRRTIPKGLVGTNAKKLESFHDGNLVVRCPRPIQIVISDIQARLHRVDLPVRFDDGDVKGAGIAGTDVLRREGNPTWVFVVFEVEREVGVGLDEIPLGYVVVGVVVASDAGVDVNVHGIICHLAQSDAVNLKHRFRNNIEHHTISRVTLTINIQRRRQGSKFIRRCRSQGRNLRRHDMSSSGFNTWHRRNRGHHTNAWHNRGHEGRRMRGGECRVQQRVTDAPIQLEGSGIPIIIDKGIAPILTRIPLLGNALSDDDIIIVKVGILEGISWCHKDLVITKRVHNGHVKPDGGTHLDRYRGKREPSGKGIRGQIKI